MQSSVRRLFSACAVVVALAAGPRPGWSSTVGDRVDINTATVAELAALPGIGEAKAKAIVEHRTADPFKTVDDLKKVKGIGDKMLESLRGSITVSGGSTGK